jgi:hypothetical protein
MLPLLSAKRRWSAAGGWLSHRSGSALLIAAQTLSTLPTPSLPAREKCALWSFLCDRGTEHNASVGQWARIPPAWESPTQGASTNTLPFHLDSWEDCLQSAIPPQSAIPNPPPTNTPPFSTFGTDGHGASLLPCDGANDDMGFLGLPQTLT